MCGLVTVFAPSTSLSEGIVAEMRDRIAHRGPDGFGLTLRRVGDMSIALAHRRLSILDLSEAGAQPMASHDGMATIPAREAVFTTCPPRPEARI